jgi:predicted transcriptional regulator
MEGIMNNTVTLPQSVIKRLEKISATTRLTPQSIISKAIDDWLDYEEWALVPCPAKAFGMPPKGA